MIVIANLQLRRSELFVEYRFSGARGLVRTIFYKQFAPPELEVSDLNTFSTKKIVTHLSFQKPYLKMGDTGVITLRKTPRRFE